MQIRNLEIEIVKFRISVWLASTFEHFLSLTTSYVDEREIHPSMSWYKLILSAKIYPLIFERQNDKSIQL